MREDEKLLDIGTTDSDCLYDFALLLSAAQDACIDRDSELYAAYHALLLSAWSQLPETVIIDFREPPKASH